MPLGLPMESLHQVAEPHCLDVLAGLNFHAPPRALRSSFSSHYGSTSFTRIGKDPPSEFGQNARPPPQDARDSESFGGSRTGAFAQAFVKVVDSHFCRGKFGIERIKLEDPSAIKSVAGCADAVAAESKCSKVFYWGDTGCRCVMEGKTCQAGETKTTVDKNSIYALTSQPEAAVDSVSEKAAPAGIVPTYYCDVSKKMWCPVDTVKHEGANVDLQYTCSGEKLNVDISPGEKLSEEALSHVRYTTAEPSEPCNEEGVSDVSSLSEPARKLPVPEQIRSPKVDRALVASVTKATEASAAEEAKQHLAAMGRIQKKVASFEREVDRMLGSGLQEAPRDGTAPLLVQAPGAEPAWIKLDWTHPAVKKAPAEIKALSGVSLQNSAGPLIPLACLGAPVMSDSSSVRPDAPFSRQRRHRSFEESSAFL